MAFQMWLVSKYWDVQYAGQTDCTERIHKHISENLPEALIYSNKVHCHMLLTPCGLPLTTFKSLPELVNIFRDLIIGEFLSCLLKFFVMTAATSSWSNGHPAERSTWRPQSQQFNHPQQKLLLHWLWLCQIPQKQCSSQFMWYCKLYFNPFFMYTYLICFNLEGNCTLYFLLSSWEMFRWRILNSAEGAADINVEGRKMWMR
jgi:hypothetical protein